MLAIYGERIESVVVDIEGNVVTQDATGNEVVAEDVSIEKNYKLAPEERLYPVFLYKGSGSEVEASIPTSVVISVFRINTSVFTPMASERVSIEKVYSTPCST